jgi:glycosyltransferase involved in cell wall biosynthesis
MKISIAICTWNRASFLRTTLESIARALPPRDTAWEILIINNNCTDSTDRVVDEFAGRLPVRLHYEQKPGLSHARNRAIDAASGKYIIWIDDDVTVQEAWLIEYERTFLGWPQASVFGGAIVPRFEGKPPQWVRWILPWVSTAFSTRNFPEGPIDAGGPLPFGANFAIRMREQRRFRYDGDLGRRPGKILIGGEEADVILGILAAGGVGRWVPSALVAHWIPRSRQNFSYLCAFYLSQIWYVPELKKRWPNINKRGI